VDYQDHGYSQRSDRETNALFHDKQSSKSEDNEDQIRELTSETKQPV